MAEARPFQLDLDSPERHTLPAYRRLGALNGLLIGLALGLGAWGLEMVRVSRLPLPLAVPTLVLGVMLLMLLGGITGWLSARIAHNVVTVILWVLAGVAVVFVLGYLPFYGRTLVTWLADPRFFGRQVFPYSLGGTISGLILGGIFIILFLAVLGLLQGYRLENLVSETQNRRVPGWRAWLALLLPLPLVFLIAWGTANALVNPAATAAQLTHRAILRAQTFDGDVRDIPPEAGISFLALRPVQDQIEGPFSLGIVDTNVETSIVTIAAHFDNGEWIHCSVINDQFNFCYDAAQVFAGGLRRLITGEPTPENCRTCTLDATDEATAWLAERQAAFGPQPVVEREAQWGNTALLRVVGEAGFTAECWLQGIAPPVVSTCTEKR